MIINGINYKEIIITSKKDKGRIVRDGSDKVVVAVISDDDKLILKDGYEVEMVPAKED